MPKLGRDRLDVSKPHDSMHRLVYMLLLLVSLKKVHP